MSSTLRCEQFVSDEICLVHCYHRCVRRAFLAGFDQLTQKDYSHRREWIRQRLESLASVFGIDVLQYAVLSNHLHVILRNRPDVVKTWSDVEVATRWLRLFPGTRILDVLAEPNEEDVRSAVADPEKIQEYRSRLSDISWFMRSLAEVIARRANAEDECRGCFWDGRFKAKRLLDEAGLLACAMYVDLNVLHEPGRHDRTLEAHFGIRSNRGRQGSDDRILGSGSYSLVPGGIDREEDQDDARGAEEGA